MKKILFLLVLVAGIVFWSMYKKEADSTPKQEIKTEKVTKGSVILKIDCNGRVVSNFDVEIKSKASGEIIEFPFDISDKVKTNDLILKLDPVDEERGLREAQTEVDIVTSQLKQMAEKIKIARQELFILQRNTREQISIDTQKYEDARRKVRDAQKLLPKKVISEDEYQDLLSREAQARSTLSMTDLKQEEFKIKEWQIQNLQYEEEILKKKVIQTEIKLETTKQRLQDTKILATIDGTVTEKFVQKGQIISSGISNVGGGTKILVLSDLSKIFVIASVDESDIGKVSLEQEVIISADAFPNLRFRGKVVQIGAKGINQYNVVTFEVKIEVLGEKKSYLKPEMTANISIVQAQKDDVLLVNSDALMYSYKTKKYTVEIMKAGNREVREVEIGLNNGMVAEVVKGLEEDTEVILQAAKKMPSFDTQRAIRRMGRPR
ncbi:MAG: efflux RND transporter periplasmic adaptor subunit [Candidatus Brocadiae bacterium]|nr:efflux RND transporter periplasmic adaptor subunit [Candidatus Brocadiia bacterium]